MMFLKCVVQLLEVKMRHNPFATLVGIIPLVASSALAQTTAPTAPAPTAPGPGATPATGSIADWWWVILIVLVAIAAIWYFTKGRNRTRL
jgi:LPXTG-motif cell wall-anchored protein